MKKLLILLILCLTASPAAALKGETSVDDILALPQTGRIEIEAVPSRDEDPRKVTFRVSLAEDQAPAAGTYDLLFLRGKILETYDLGITLPYEFERTFKGMPDGSHQLLFSVTNDQGFAAQKRLSLSIPYRKEDALREKFDAELQARRKHLEQLNEKRRKLAGRFQEKLVDDRREKIEKELREIDEDIKKTKDDIARLTMQLEQG